MNDEKQEPRVETNDPGIPEVEEQEGDLIIEPPPDNPTDAQPPKEGSQGSSIKGVAPPPDDSARRA